MQDTRYFEELGKERRRYLCERNEFVNAKKRNRRRRKLAEEQRKRMKLKKERKRKLAWALLNRQRRARIKR